jgi:hypothetical protein
MKVRYPRAFSWTATSASVQVSNNWSIAASVSAGVNRDCVNGGGKGTISTRVAPPLKRICAKMWSPFSTVTSSMSSRTTRFRSRSVVRGSCQKRVNSCGSASIVSRSVVLRQA